MAGYQCPFCNAVMPITNDTRFEFISAFRVPSCTVIKDWSIYTDMYQCPHCSRTSIRIEGYSGEVENIQIGKYPISNAKQYPDYVPKAIRDDYEESYAIVDRSPKASATLARRCLQGMIRDRWGIVKDKLISEIKELQPMIPSDQWKVIDAVRKIGNIGAHMEKDVNLIIEVEPGESEKLLKLIEMLIKEWYIDRHAQEELYAEILGIAADKTEKKKEA